MITSRALVLGRLISAGLKAKAGSGHNTQIIRNSHAPWNYRTGPTNHSKKTIIGTQVVSGFMWWWILWHLWHEYEHITGEFEYPDVLKWTNAELGIPPDNYEE